jgi:hypothetical protein
MSIESLIRFRQDLEDIKKTGNIIHDKYLDNLKKVIDKELSKPDPEPLKVMQYITLNRMKLDFLGFDNTEVIDDQS